MVPWWHHLKIPTKTVILKTNVRPVTTFTTKTRPEAGKTKSNKKILQMKILREIAGETLTDRGRADTISGICNVEIVNSWIHTRKWEWVSKSAGCQKIEYFESRGT